MIKKLQRIVKAVTLMALPLMLVFTLLNILLLAQYKSTDTTLILKEKVIQKGSDSSSDGNTSNDKFKQRLDTNKAENIRDEIDNVNENTLPKKKSGDGEKVSNNAIENTEVVNEENRDRVEMQDDNVDKMIKKLKGYTRTSPFFPKYFWNATLYELTRSLGSAARKFANTLSGYKTIKL